MSAYSISGPNPTVFCNMCGHACDQRVISEYGRSFCSNECRLNQKKMLQPKAKTQSARQELIRDLQKLERENAARLAQVKDWINTLKDECSHKKDDGTSATEDQPFCGPVCKICGDCLTDDDIGV